MVQKKKRKHCHDPTKVSTSSMRLMVQLRIFRPNIVTGKNEILKFMVLFDLKIKRNAGPTFASYEFSYFNVQESSEQKGELLRVLL